MKQTTTDLLFLTIFVTLLIGTSLSLQNMGLVPLYGIYYLACFLILRSFHYGEDFFRTFERTTMAGAETKVVVAGEEVETGMEGNLQEDRFLNVFETTRVVKRKVITWLLFLGSMWFIFYFKGMEISIPTVLPLVSCFFIVNSFFVGHLLMVLLLNLISVVLAYSNEVSVFLYSLYGLSLLVSLAFISFSRMGELKSVLTIRKLKMPLLLTIFTIGLVFGFGSLIPGALQWNPKEFKLQDKEQRQMLQALSKFQQNTQKMSSKLAAIKPPQALAETFSEMQSKLAGNLSRIEALKSHLGKTELSESERAEGLKMLDELMQEQDSLAQDYEELLKKNFSLPEPTKDEAQAFKSLEGSLKNDERNHLRSYLNRTSEELKKLPRQNQSELEQQIKTMTEALDKGQEQVKGEDLKNHLEKLETFKHQLQTDSVREVLRDTHLKKLAEQEKQAFRKNLEEKKADRLSKLKRLLPVLVISFLLLLANYLLRKKSIKKVKNQDVEIQEELKEEWKRLRKLNLSPREEVIHYYNLFHETLKKMHYESGETPPSCIVYEDMQELNPELSKATLAITEIFAQCFYGNKNVDDKALKLYRKALGKILKVYQLE